ncbi:hypothetical protein [Emticicia sp. C21]|nr:hypothetical protein [Emticicia sp. C21]
MEEKKEFQAQDWWLKWNWKRLPTWWEPFVFMTFYSGKERA